MTAETYTLIDSGNLQKLEKVGKWKILRPSLQALWNPNASKAEWDARQAWFLRDETGGGKWFYREKHPPGEFIIDSDGYKFKIKFTGFGHIGLFPEQSENMKWISRRISGLESGSQILNLFAYTGAVTIACASAGAQVTHVDASKGVVEWARENAALSCVRDASVRWIVDDVRKFVKREINRQKKYDGIILDPPTFGRGTKNELWKIEEHLNAFLGDLTQLFSSRFDFLILSCHTPGYTPKVMENLLKQICPSGGMIESGEMLLTEACSGRVLPSGACARWHR